MDVLKPIRIGNKVLKNRFIMAPMGPELGDFDQRTNDYYLRRAQGGASMIMTNVLATEAIDGPGPSSLLNESSVSGYQVLVEGCHQFNCKVCLQVMPGVGLGGMAAGRTGPASVSATPIYPGAAINFQELSISEIEFIKGEVMATVKYAQAAGVDMVEIHAYGGYLTDKFMTPRWNTRTDQYGGSFENRMRFLSEIIDGIKAILKDQTPLIVKYTPSHHLPESSGYRSIEEGKKIAKWLVSKGVDALHVDVGCHDNWALAMPPIYQQSMAPQLDVARQIKTVVDIPVISNGRLGDLGKVESAITNQWIDVAAVGRQFLADPDFVTKLENNRVDQIRYCIYCNEGCIKNVVEGKSISCAVNPQAGFEGLKDIIPNKRSKKLLVIGAGPAGCEAAIRAKEAGHEVEIWEKEAYLGGNFYSACLPPFKRDGNKLLSYYQMALKEQGINLKLSHEGTLEGVKAYQPDGIIYGGGSFANRPQQIPGINLPHVATAIETLQERAIVGNQVVIIGGGLVGCETALTLASQGKEVTIIERADKLLPEPLFVQNLMMLSQMLKESTVKSELGTVLEAIEETAILVSKAGKSQRIPCDTVVLAMGFTPNQTLFKQLVEAGYQVKNVGDSLAVRKVLDAVHEAYDAVLEF